MQRQKLSLNIMPKLELEMDIIDEQSASQHAEAIAKELIKKHGKNIKKIKTEAFKIKNPYKGFDLIKEITWAAGWLIKT